MRPAITGRRERERCVRGVSEKRETRAVGYSKRTRAARPQITAAVTSCAFRPVDVGGENGDRDLTVDRTVLGCVDVHAGCGTIYGGVAIERRWGRRACTEGQRTEGGVERAD